MAKKGNKSGFGSARSNAPKAVSTARLAQKSGASHSYGGYAKVNLGNGAFTMKKVGDGR